MLGRFVITVDGQCVDSFHSQKALELFCFLLLYPKRIHHRDKLADLFWGDRCTSESKKYFRKTLWQLQSSLDQFPYHNSTDLILVDKDWLQLNLCDSICVDVMEFENIFNKIKDLRGRKLQQKEFISAQRAEGLYVGDLLEGCYQDWCIYERERLKDMYFALIYKLMGYCETHREYNSGIQYGRKLLALDWAHESTHLRLMRLYYISGDRTSAIRQYEACKAALRQEFDIEPGEKVMELYRQLTNDSIVNLNFGSDLLQDQRLYQRSNANVEASLIKIRELLALQCTIPELILEEIRFIETALSTDK